jgi:spore coat polysaccharide biosynthesis predicted glycosyltransferase SpsG
MTLLFVCDAHTAMGFGHASRCLHLARLVAGRVPDGADVAFQGTFSDGARQRLLSAFPGLAIVDPDRPVHADVAVVDRMTDTENLEVWDPQLIDALRRHSARVIYLASGVTAPPLPEDVECIGYQPGGPPPRPPAIRWGLEYAPVAVDAPSPAAVARESDRVLIAFGGSPDNRALSIALDAVRANRRIRHVDVLLSPVTDAGAPDLRGGDHQTLTAHRNVPSVRPLIERAALVIASYGHLGWEALSLGSAVCFLGQKAFQIELADRLAQRGLAVSAGGTDAGARTLLDEAIQRALADAPSLRARARAAVDGRGLDRIAGIICEGVRAAR